MLDKANISKKTHQYESVIKYIYISSLTQKCIQ